LSVFELSAHSRFLTKKFKTEKMRHWSAKARIAQLKVSRPTLRESAKRASAEHNIYKFCNDIISAHRTGAMGGGNLHCGIFSKMWQITLTARNKELVGLIIH
jgi:hypothetical protein